MSALAEPPQAGCLSLSSGVSERLKRMVYPLLGAPLEVRIGARRPVPAALAERPLRDQTWDLRRDERQWARCAGNGHQDLARQIEPLRQARPLAISISTLITSRPFDWNLASRSVTPSRTAR